MRAYVVACLLVLSACAVAPDYLGLRVSTVKVSEGFGHGSGTFVGPDLVLTAAHVVRPEGPIELEFPDGKKMGAAVLWLDDKSDLALLKAERKVNDYAKVSCEPLKLGERVLTFGNPGFLRFVLTEGIVANTENMGAQKAFLPEGMPIDIEPMVVVSANWEPGDSGSAVFDHQGHIRGVVSIVFPVEGSRSNNALITPTTALPDCKGKAA